MKQLPTALLVAAMILVPVQLGRLSDEGAARVRAEGDRDLGPLQTLPMCQKIEPADRRSK